MEFLNVLSRSEMKNVKGGYGPECFKCCSNNDDSNCSACVSRWNPVCSGDNHLHSCSCGPVIKT